MRRGRAATMEDIRDVRDSLQHLSREMTHVVSLEEALFAKERALDAMSRKSKSTWRSVQKDARQLRSVSSENMILQKRLNGMVRRRLDERLHKHGCTGLYGAVRGCAVLAVLSSSVQFCARLLSTNN